MKFMLFVLPTVPATLEDRKRYRPIGRNNERYQQMLEEMRKLAVLADDAGFDVFATTEHHFHSEGYETSVAPLLLYADLAARTKRIRFALLGLVLPAWDPIRAAEELAVFDHLTRGRLYAGFARGYQDRWVNVLGQQYHVTGAPMDGSAIDQHNRRVYEEAVQVIKKAWTEETFEFNGQYYKVPFPYAEDIRRWPVAEWTRQYDPPGEIDDPGVIRTHRAVPLPSQDPTRYPLAPYTALPPTEWTVDRMRGVKYALAGTPEQVRAEIDDLQSLGGGGKLEWFGWFFDQGFMPWEEEVRQIELFAKHIIPRFR